MDIELHTELVRHIRKFLGQSRCRVSPVDPAVLVGPAVVAGLAALDTLVGRCESRPQEQRAADMVIELLVLGDIETPLGQEASHSVDDAGSFRTGERQDKRGRISSGCMDTAGRKVSVEWFSGGQSRHVDTSL
jgi:hypothetical protein